MTRELDAEYLCAPWRFVPWHIAEGSAQVRSADGWLVCEAPSDEFARVIAATPELLAAAKAAKKFLIDDLEEPGRTVFWGLVAAISKAEGRTP